MAQTITPTIVNLTAVLTVAPTPSQLQQSGALVSVGGTTQTSGTAQYYGSLAAVQAALQTTGTGNYAELLNMATTFFAQGSSVGLYILELGTQATGAAGVEALNTWITNNPNTFYAFLVPASWDAQSEVVGSVSVTNGGTGYTTAPTVTFAAPPAGGVTATGTATIANGVVTGVTITNPGTGYTAAPTVTFSAPTTGTTATGTAALASELNIVAGQYASVSSKTYFFVTTTVANVASYAPNKSVCAFVPSPTATSQEFGAAAYFYNFLVNQPSATAKLAPQSYRFVYGVTPWPQTGYAANIQTVLSAYGNLVLTGAEGGISNAAQFKGTFMDGSQMSWWWGVDWYQITVKRDLAAAIINGSNSNPPLLYDQNGINQLAAIAQRDINTGVSFGCLLSGSITATSFATYTQQNPTNYKAGLYGGLAATIVGQNGFLQINFFLDAVEFAS